MKKNIKIISTILTSCTLMLTSTNVSALTGNDVLQSRFEEKMQNNSQWDTDNNYNYVKMWNKDVYICEDAEKEWFNQYNDPNITTDLSKWKTFDDYLNYITNGNDDSKIGILSVSDDIKNQTDVVIPSQIDGKTVAGIYKKIFWKANIENLTIPNSVEYIGDEAFLECYNLKSLTIPEGVTNIGKYTFLDAGKNTGLSELIVPKSVKKIGKWGVYFGNDSEERTVVLSKDVIFYRIYGNGSYVEKRAGDMTEEEIEEFVGIKIKLKFYEDEPGYIPEEETPETPPTSEEQNPPATEEKPSDDQGTTNNDNTNTDNQNSNNNNNNNNNQTEQKPNTGDATNFLSVLSTIIAAGLTMKKTKKQ